MSSRRSISKNEVEEEELILGGFSCNSSNSSDSDSELSETWSELGAQIFGDENYQDQNIVDYAGSGCGFNGSFDGEYSQEQESDVILDMKIDNPVIVYDNSTTTSSSTETELFFPSTRTLSINHSPNLNKLFSKCNLCPPSSTTYFHGEDNVRNHIDQVHKNRNKKTTTAQSTTIPTATSSGILQSKEPIQIQSQQLQPSCSICYRKFISLEFSKIHYQFHLEGLKCIDSTCQMICTDLAELKSHTSLCPLALRCKKETKTRHTLSPINCVFTDCTRGFFNDLDFLGHLKTFHRETLQTLLSKKFGTADSGYNKPTTGEDVKVDIDELELDMSDSLSQAINSVAKGAGSVVINGRKSVISEERKEKSREQYRIKRANETEDQRTERLARESEITRERLAKEADLILTCSLGYIPPDVMDSIDEIIELVVQGQGTEPFNVKLERKKRKAELRRKQLLEETEEQRAERLEKQRIRQQKRLLEETEEQREKRLEKQRIRSQTHISKEIDEQRGERSIEDQKPNLNLLQIGILRCDICSRDFERKADLTRHNRTNHPEVYHAPAADPNGEICEVCGKIFVTSYSFKIHSISHKEKIYTCSFENCTKSFAIERYLSGHISRFHSPTSGQLLPKIFLCDLCGQSFSRLRYYKDHKERHSRILAMRKEAYEDKLRVENPSKSDQEFGEMLQKFWGSEESNSLVVDPETYEEKKAMRKQDFIEKIKRMGLQRYGENVEECLARINKERLEKIWKKREAETEEERQRRRERYLRGFNKYVQKNKNAYFKRIKENDRLKEYHRNRWRKLIANPEFRAKSLAKDRARWAKKTPEQKAKRLESMRNYQKQRKRKLHD